VKWAQSPAGREPASRKEQPPRQQAPEDGQAAGGSTGNATIAALEVSTRARRGTAVSVVAIMPVLYSLPTARMPKTAMTA
jgi:hypothetical protein